MSLENLYNDLKEVYEVKQALGPIETAIARAQAQYDKVAQEVATLTEEAESLKNAVAEAQEIKKSAEQKELAAQIVLDQAMTRAAQKEDEAQRKATRILSEAMANKKDFGDQAEAAMLRLRDLNNDIELLEEQKQKLEAEVGPLKAEVETLRHQRAAYLRQEMGV